MARIPLGGLVVPLNTGTHLDPMFVELYAPIDGTGGAAHKIIGGGSSAGSVSSVYSLLGSTNLVFVDSARSANNKVVDFAWGGGIFSGRFLNDAYSLAANWITVTGGYAAGVATVGFGGNISANTDNAYSCGFSSFRWTTIYAATGTINTSDAREKTAVAPLSQAELAAASDLAREIGGFQFLEALAAKGPDARQHIGMTVQRAMQVLRSHGLDPLRYAFICRDVWAEKTIEHPALQRAHDSLLDAKGLPVMVVTRPAWTEVTPAGDRYGFRVDQLLLFIARGFEARLAALEAAA